MDVVMNNKVSEITLEQPYKHFDPINSPEHKNIIKRRERRGIDKIMSIAKNRVDGLDESSPIKEPTAIVDKDILYQ